MSRHNARKRLIFLKSIYLSVVLYSYFVLLARFPRGQLQPVVFSTSCFHRSLAKIHHSHM
ncbi:hypothetical protein BUZ00_00695 [Staphylococcus gallinarum]|nr:hypothetical protein BUZ00_00695 [Staphylococcus gallinarum]PTK92676.1 hypothetical protein BUZ03_01860 [Staphylococcus gallinarum]PTK96937.1 hypothetical protein BUZ13_00130 [Staphylococcus gallinarum]PTK97092.1 hypothetical protein BUZ05_00220 [Staphylococcus gallinarum]RIL25288.1 hypothetical protein BUY99_00375 [Staphylococcus gallinarum]